MLPIIKSSVRINKIDKAQIPDTRGPIVIPRPHEIEMADMPIA